MGQYCVKVFPGSTSRSCLEVEFPVGVTVCSTAGVIPDSEYVQVVVTVRAVHVEGDVPRHRLAASLYSPQDCIDPPPLSVRGGAAPERDAIRALLFIEPNAQPAARVDPHGCRVPGESVGAGVAPAVRDQASLLELSRAPLQDRLGRVGGECLPLPLN